MYEYTGSTCEVFMCNKLMKWFSLIVAIFLVCITTNVSIKGKETDLYLSSYDNDLKIFLDNSYSELYCVTPSNAVAGQPIRITIQTWNWCEK